MMPGVAHDIDRGPTPHCHSEQIVKRGKAARGLQGYLGLLAPCGLTRYDTDH